MNKRVLLVAICCAMGMLLSVYIGKLFFPSWIIGIATTPQILAVGKFIDANWIVNDVCCFIINIITLTLLSCAIAGKWHPNLWQFGIITAVAFLTVTTSYLEVPIARAINLTSPLLCAWAINPNSRIKNIVIVLGVNYFTQALTLSIRGIGDSAAIYNFASLLIILIDCYISIVLLYLYFNYQKKENNNGRQISRTSTVERQETNNLNRERSD